MQPLYRTSGQTRNVDAREEPKMKLEQVLTPIENPRASARS